jgi:hypothetical protein
MQPIKFDTATLAAVDDRHYYSVTCQSCLRSARLSLLRLRGLLGGDFPVVGIRGRLRCSTCGSKQITTTFLGPHQAVGNLAYLFKEVPR